MRSSAPSRLSSLYPNTRELLPYARGPIATPHHGQASTMKGLAPPSLLRRLYSWIASECRFGVTAPATQKPIEIGTEPNLSGSRRRMHSRAHIREAALRNCWVVSRRSVYLIRTVTPAFSDLL